MNYLSIELRIHIVESDAAAVFLIEGFFICLMGNSDDGKKISRTLGMDSLSLSIPPNKISRDLLQRFMGSAGEPEIESVQDEGIELNLGLSLGGRFGVDKSSSKLKRSSSIASCLPAVRDDNCDAVAPTTAAYTGLARTSSLPLEAEEEWRKRKEWQTLRRMEAKRRRSEKQRNLKADKGGEGNGDSRNMGMQVRKETEVIWRGRLEKEMYLAPVKRPGSSVESGGGMDVIVVKGKGRFTGTEGKHEFGNLASQGSLESKGGSSSSASDMGSKTPQGSGGRPSPPEMQEPSNRDSNSSSSKSGENTETTTGSSKSKTPFKRPDTSINQGANPLEDMPCVFTRGDGPTGRRVDGILYKYGKGQEVRIMCICHGTFHSPAEFVMHAGGTDVNHPLKHIVVNRNAPSLL